VIFGTEIGSGDSCKAIDWGRVTVGALENLLMRLVQVFQPLVLSLAKKEGEAFVIAVRSWGFIAYDVV
jgi:hypothetical protein